MKIKNYIRKAALLASITLAGICFGQTTGMKAYAGPAAIPASGAAVQAGTGETTKNTAKKTDQLYPASKQVNGEEKYGYIDNKGNFIIQPVYTSAGNFNDGAAVVFADNKYEVINVKGKVLFKTDGSINDFHNGMAVFSDPKYKYLCGYINTKGKIVIKPMFLNAGDFNNKNRAFVASKNRTYTEIDKTGKIIKNYKLSSKYGKYYDLCKDGYFIFHNRNGLTGVFDLKGRLIFKPIYGEIDYLGNNLFGIKKNPSIINMGLLQKKPAALFNKDGKQLTKYNLFDLSEFYGKYASATDSKYTYLIGQDGKRVSSFPKLEGRGTMKLIGNIIQANIDNDLIYLKKDGTIIWKVNRNYSFASGITVNAVKFKPIKFVTVNYPMIDGLSDKNVQNAINSKLKTIFTKNRKNIKEKDNLEVDDSFTAEQMNNLLMIRRSGYDYLLGAAHGMPLRDYYFIDLKTGKFYQLKDLFKNNSNYVTKLSDIVKKQMQGEMKNNDNYFFMDTYKGIKKDQYFYVKKDSLVIYFGVYDIAAYAAGFPEFEIPFKDIDTMINKDGAFWKSFQG